MILTLKSSGFIEAGILFVYENNGKEFFRFISFKDEELDGKKLYIGNNPNSEYVLAEGFYELQNNKEGIIIKINQ